MIIGQIATEHLTPQAKSASQAMLAGKSLADVANWADEIKSDHKYDWAKPCTTPTCPKVRRSSTWNGTAPSRDAWCLPFQVHRNPAGRQGERMQIGFRLSGS